MTKEHLLEDLRNYGDFLESRNLPTTHTISRHRDNIYLTSRSNKKDRKLEWRFELEDGESMDLDLALPDPCFPENPVVYLPRITTVSPKYHLGLTRGKRSRRVDDIVCISFYPEDFDFGPNITPVNGEQREIARVIMEKAQYSEGGYSRSDHPELPKLLIEKMIELWAQDGFSE